MCQVRAILHGLSLEAPCKSQILAAGFPVVLVTLFAYDVTGDGILVSLFYFHVLLGVSELVTTDNKSSG